MQVTTGGLGGGQGEAMKKEQVGWIAAVVIVATTALVGITGGTAGASSGRTREIRVFDSCDPASFNAAIGPDTCAPVADDPVTFDEFLAKLNPVDFGHEDWAFSRDEVGVRPGERMHIVNRGGEFHTLSRVAMLGGGCVPFINGALGLAGPVAECGDPNVFTPPTATTPPNFGASANGVPPMASIDVTAPMAAGRYHYMCLIHPWMRTDVNVKS